MKGKAFITIVCFAVVGMLLYRYSTRQYFSSNNPILSEVRANFSKLDPEYSKIPLREGDSAYTENKEVITLCLADPESKKQYDLNTIMYVAIHELAHVVSKNTGHGPEFKKNFSMLLKLAAKKGVYDPRKSIPASYCGTASGRH
jgi:hypothetical protein